MARALTFDLGGTAFQAEPVKLDRKKVYGWTETAATDGAHFSESESSAKLA